MHKLRFRQVHLDFHTSPHIPDIGVAFDKRQFQDALKQGHVNSITCFAAGHHGWHYNNTEVGKRHPNLTFDLLRAQYDACKEIDVNVPVYLTAGVNNRVAHEHPEWREIGPDGRYTGWASNIIDPGFHLMCFNTPYMEYMEEVIAETVNQFPEADGIFLDIISQGECCCKWCLARMEQRGLDARRLEDRQANAEQVLNEYYRRSTEAVWNIKPDMPVFHNSGHIARGKRDVLEFFSHLELESLPTGGWGYDHFPISAKYVHKLGKDYLGMTGKFHTTWGEFGGYKHPNALRYECAAMLAFNAKCSIGDQLHPGGKMDPSTYSLIGGAYAEVERKEPWCENAEPIADIGILSNQSINGVHGKDDAADTGVGRALLEGHYLFDLLDRHMDFSPYRLLILPDAIKVDKELKQKIDAYLKQGGKLLLTGESGLRADGSGVAFDIGAEHEGPSEFSPDYVLPLESFRPDFLDSPFVMYLRSQRIKVTDGESLGDVYDPYFNRTYQHFCSHQHTPPRPEPSGYACGVRKGPVMYLAHPVFSLYRGIGAVATRDYALKCVESMLEKRTVTCNLPTTGRVTLTHQPEQKRYVVHALYANTVARGGQFTTIGDEKESQGYTIEVVEDLVPLNNVSVGVELDAKVKRATLEPQGTEIPFEESAGRVTVTLETLLCHQMIALHY